MYISHASMQRLSLTDSGVEWMHRILSRTSGYASLFLLSLLSQMKKKIIPLPLHLLLVSHSHSSMHLSYSSSSHLLHSTNPPSSSQALISPPPPPLSLHLSISLHVVGKNFHVSASRLLSRMHSPRVVMVQSHSLSLPLSTQLSILGYPSLPLIQMFVTS